MLKFLNSRLISWSIFPTLTITDFVKNYCYKNDTLSYQTLCKGCLNVYTLLLNAEEKSNGNFFI